MRPEEIREPERRTAFEALSPEEQIGALALMTAYRIDHRSGTVEQARRLRFAEYLARTGRINEEGNSDG